MLAWKGFAQSCGTELQRIATSCERACVQRTRCNGRTRFAKTNPNRITLQFQWGVGRPPGADIRRR
jgi:hypothetical protein